jgi:eukaryotic-like serine/threonine-protein kinase
VLKITPTLSSLAREFQTMLAVHRMTTLATSTAAHLPRQIGKYRVLARLGEGATSEVFHCRDEFRGVEVAIKCVKATEPNRPTHAGSSGHYYAKFFAAEAALVGKLNHPNLVQILDAVPDPSRPHLVMEYVQGTTLKAYCKPDALLPLEQVVELGFKCAMALGYCYRQGLIHRDVKPANILAVVQDGRVVDVKITDFGSVFQMNAEATQIHRVGSLSYMSPEQLDGATLDARADMYSLSAVLYHMLSGRTPFDGQTQGALMNQIFNEQPPALASVRSGIPQRLNDVVMRGLAKEPQQRFADWDSFAQALAEVISLRELPALSSQGVLDSERFTLLRQLEFFAGFGDVELWEVVHRARWQRHGFGDALFKKGTQGNNFFILAHGAVDVYRDSNRVAQLGRGTSVGEMAYLAPSDALRTHQADVVVSTPATTISFNRDSMEQLSPETRHKFDAAFIHVLVRRLHAAHEQLNHPRRIL